MLNAAALPLRRLPAHLINGLTVAAGIGLVEVLFFGLADARSAQLAVSGAICASLADRPVSPARCWRVVLLAGTFGWVAALTMMLLAPYQLATGIGVLFITFAALMSMAWGPRARPVSFGAILAIVFTMALPPGIVPLEAIRWNVFGVLVYVAWAWLSSLALQARYRSLFLAATLAAAAQLLRSRARRYAGDGQDGDETGLRDWIRDESALAERLQAARDLLFVAPAGAQADQLTAILLRAIELRDTLLASRIDLELLGDDAAGERIRAGLARELQALAARLDAAALRVRGLPAPVPTALPPCTPAGLFGELGITETDPRARLLAPVTGRVQRLRDDADRVEALLRGDSGPPSLARTELRHFVNPEGWPFAALRSHASLASPVARHALRAALALTVAYYAALVLPWTSHPQWLVLSVAVVLQGNLEQTLARRNARVIGTALGCMLALLLLAGLRSPVALLVSFVAAAGIAHAYAVERYFIAAIGATVMALLQAELANPAVQVPVAERLADTVLGALLAWAFSFVLPTWEVRGLPGAIARAQAALRDYARQSLRADSEGAVAQRLARRRAYDELGALSAALQRSAVEPERVRPPVRELATLLDHAHRLMAHLSLVRLTLARNPAELSQPEVTARLRAVESDLVASLTPTPSSRLAAEPPAGLDQLPPDPPAENIRPWFERRLQWTLNDAQELARATQRALEGLGSAKAAATP